jgi:hypothetical protein
MSRRLVNVMWSYETLCELFARLDGANAFRLHGLPETVSIAGVAYDHERRVLVITFESPHFVEAADGDALPRVALDLTPTPTSEVLASLKHRNDVLQAYNAVLQAYNAELEAVFGDRVQDSDVARLAVARENEACAKEADACALDNLSGESPESAAVW